MRDFTDVLDMVEAYTLAMDKGENGDVYNLGSGKGVTIQWILETLLALSTTKIEVKQDPARMQPSDVPALVSNPAKFSQLTGWKAEIPFEQTLARVLDYWRTIEKSN